jgi:hypothetical protein
LEAEAASLNWVAALVSAVVLVAGAGLNRLVEEAWDQVNILIALITPCPKRYKLSASVTPA